MCFLHVKYEFELGFQLRIVYFEHRFHKLLLVNVLIIIFIHDLEEPLTQNTRQVHILHKACKNVNSNNMWYLLPRWRQCGWFPWLFYQSALLNPCKYPWNMEWTHTWQSAHFVQCRNLLKTLLSLLWQINYRNHPPAFWFVRETSFLINLSSSFLLILSLWVCLVMEIYFYNCKAIFECYIAKAVV